MFKVDLIKDEPHWRLVLSGAVSERSVFPQLNLDGQTQVILDLERVESMNSMGIRQWVDWVRSLPASTTFVFTRCPGFLTLYFGTVGGMLPPTAELESFLVAYVHPTTGDTEFVEFRMGKQFTREELMMPSVVTSETSGQHLELDVVPERLVVALKAFYPKIKLMPEIKFGKS